MRHAPVAVHRVAVEAAADVIAHPAERHRPQRLHHHRQRDVVAGALVLAQQEQQFARPGKLRRIAEPAAAGIEASAEIAAACWPARPHPACRRSFCPRAIAASRSTISAADFTTFRRSSRHARPISVSTSTNAGPPVLRRRREIGAAVKGLQIRRQPYAHRPAAGAGGGLHERHVDAIDVGPFLAIDLDRDELSLRTRATPCSRTTRAPSRGTSGRWRSRWRERSACRSCAPPRRPRGPTDTNRPGCSRAAAGTDSAPSLVDSALLHDT